MSHAGKDTAGSSSSSITQINGDVGFVVPLAGIINVVGGPNVSTSGDNAQTLTINVSATSLTWTAVTSASNPVALVKSNGYICNGVSQVNFTLPVSAAIGDSFIITGNTSLFQIQQGAGQQIFFGTQSTSAGVTGTLTSLQAQDHIEMICIVTNTTFKIIDSIGNLTIA